MVCGAACSLCGSRSAQGFDNESEELSVDAICKQHCGLRWFRALWQGMCYTTGEEAKDDNHNILEKHLRAFAPIVGRQTHS